ncbi:MAG: VWA domain-containing protein [Candidatus Ranarchaeia archaeon]
MIPHFSGCNKLSNRFDIPFSSMERLKRKLIELLEEGLSPENALDKILDDLQNLVPETQDMILEELMKNLPEELAENLKELLKDLLKNKKDLHDKLRKKRNEEFEEILQKILNRKDIKKIKDIDPKKSDKSEPRKLPVHMQMDFPQMLDDLESVIKSMQSKGQPLKDLLNDFSELKKIVGRSEIPEEKNLDEKDVSDSILNEIKKKIREKMLTNLKEAGLMKLDKGKLTFGRDLVDILADKILDETLKELKREEEGIRATKSGEEYGEISQVGELIKSSEMGNLLPIETLLSSIQRHPDEITIKPEEDPIKVWKYEKETVFDTVIAVDMSGSMNRNYKHKAAKETALALEKAVKRINPKNRCALILFHSEAKITTPNELWTFRPTGYTNTPEALKLANETLKKWNSRAGYILFVTDGYPELSGQSHSKVLQNSIKEAKNLRYLKHVLFRMVLIENQNRFIEAGKSIVKSAGGKLIITNPNKLKDHVLVDFLRGFKEIISI